MDQTALLASKPKSQEEAVAVLDAILAEIDRMDARMDERREEFHLHRKEVDRLKKLAQRQDAEFARQMKRIDEKLSR